MTIKTTTHLNFRGDARAALSFYQLVFGGDMTVVTYKDAGNLADPADADKVLWGQVVSAEGFSVMAYDVAARQDWQPGLIPFFVSVRGNSDDEVTGYWAGLSAGATIIQPLAPAGWSSLYGMLEDRFGITWVLDVVSYPG